MTREHIQDSTGNSNDLGLTIEIEEVRDFNEIEDLVIDTVDEEELETIAIRDGVIEPLAASFESSIDEEVEVEVEVFAVDDDVPESLELEEEDLQTLDEMHAIVVEHALESEDSDEAEWVHSSELIEPLLAIDVIDLDYEEDLPTRIDGRRRETPSLVAPAQVDKQDVFYLTDQKRPNLELVEEGPVNMADVLRTVPKLPRVTLPPVNPPPIRNMAGEGPRTTQLSSLAPVAMPMELEQSPANRNQPAKSRLRYGATIAALAAAAALIAVWPTKSSSEALEGMGGMEDQASAARLIQTPEDRGMAPVVHELDVISIVVEEELAPATVVAAKRPHIPANPSWPGRDVVIDDSTQLTDGVVFPSEPLSKPLHASTSPEGPDTLQPPEPEKNLPPFEPSAADSALNALASSALSCRGEGATQRWPTRVSVTFAPTGRVTTATVEGPQVSGTAVGGCVARIFRSARMNPYSGPPVTVHKTYSF